ARWIITRRADECCASLRLPFRQTHHHPRLQQEIAADAALCYALRPCSLKIRQNGCLKASSVTFAGGCVACLSFRSGESHKCKRAARVVPCEHSMIHMAESI